MSKVTIQGDASGTGIFTIASPNSNTDRTLVLPDEAGTVLTDRVVAVDVSAPDDSLVVDASGNVGIGTSSPLNTVANRGNLTINGSTDAILTFGNGGSSAGFVLQDSGGMTLFSAGATYQRFYTNGAERMRIDSTGRVTMPYQPAFAAYINGSVFSSSPIFNTVVFNVGNAYNSTTGTFTAPIAGTYLFNAWYRFNQTGTTYCQFSLARNGSSTGWNGGYINSTAQNTTYATPSVSIAYYLSAGDTVKPSAAISGGSPTISGPESWFNGYLIG